MLLRREFLHLSLAAAGMTGVPVAAQDRFDQAALLAFEPLGTVTLCHVGDLRGQLVPHFLRPPEQRVRPGGAVVSEAYLVGEGFRIRYGVGGGTPMDYAFTHENFTSLASAYGPMGGLDRVAGVVNAIQAERPGALLLASAAMGTETVSEVMAAPGQIISVEESGGPEAVSGPYRLANSDGVKIAVIGLPRGSEEPSAFLGRVQQAVNAARADGAAIVVYLSQMHIDADAALARAVSGIDVILSGRGVLALPEPVLVEDTYLIASGSQGRFVSRIDLEVEDGLLRGLRHKLIPIFAELIAPDPQVTARIAARRADVAEDMGHVVGRAEVLLNQGGTFHSSWDDLICAALQVQQEAEIALVPAMHPGPTLLPGQDVTREHVHAVTAGMPRQVATRRMTGAALKSLMEDAGDRFANPDPLLRDAPGMMRVGGIGFRFDMGEGKGDRISEMRLLKGGAPIDPTASFLVADGSAAPAQDGTAVRALLERHIMQHGTAVTGPVGRVALVPVSPGLPPRISRRPPSAP